MKDIVLILSKTKMNNNQVCVGGLTLSGRYVRLMDENGNNQPENTDLETNFVFCGLFPKIFLEKLLLKQQVGYW